MVYLIFSLLILQPLISLEKNCLDLSQTAVISVNQHAPEGLRGHGLFSPMKIRIHDLQTGSQDDKLKAFITLDGCKQNERNKSIPEKTFSDHRFSFRCFFLQFDSSIPINLSSSG